MNRPPRLTGESHWLGVPFNSDSTEGVETGRFRQYGSGADLSENPYSIGLFSSGSD